MAKRGRDTRIEPSFDGPAPKRGGGDGLSLSEDDRVVPSAKRAKKPAKPAREPAARGRSRSRARRGFGMFGSLVYWSLVLALWGGIGVAGIVAYYGARMPSAITWTVPDRPPNVKIVSADDQLLANRGMTGGEALSLSEMSPYIPQALIAIEDRRFYSISASTRSALGAPSWTNVMQGRFVPRAARR
jgi:penicillin-binding protein 1A